MNYLFKNVPKGKIQTIPQMDSHPQIHALEVGVVLQELSHKDGGLATSETDFLKWPAQRLTAV